MNTPAVTDQPLPNPPIICRLAVALLGILVALSALPWSYYSLNHFGGFNWGLLGFELVTLLAGIFGVLFGLGKFRSGWAIGVTAIAGAILVAMVFGIYVDFVMAKQTDYPSLAPLAKYTLLARASTVGAYFLFASIAVFARNKQSLPYIVKAVLCAVPVIVVGALMKTGIGPGNWINNTIQQTSGSNAMGAVVTITLGLIFIVLVSAAGHLLIRAYECGRPDVKNQ